MGMQVGGNKGGAMADMNVVPLIDILLVLLIIFMVITPLTPKGLEALVPQPPPPHQPETQTDRTVVVQVIDENGKIKYRINQEDVELANLATRLTDIFKTRAERVMFVKGDPDVEFQNVAQVIDIARGTNVVDKIGLITAKIEAGQ